SMTFPGSTSLLDYTTAAGIYQDWSTYRLYATGHVAKDLEATASLYYNQYRYYVPNPNDPNYNIFEFTQPTPSERICNNFIDPKDPHITDFSAKTFPRFSFEWRPNPNVAVPGSAGSGIAPIDLQQFLGGSGTPQPNSLTNPTFYSE